MGRVIPILWIFVVVMLFLTMLGTIISWFQMNVDLDTNMKLRTATWIAHRLTGSTECLAQGITSPRKNVLSAAKIGTAVSDHGNDNMHSCAPIFCFAYEVEIYDFFAYMKDPNAYSSSEFGELEYLQYPVLNIKNTDENPEVFVMPVSIQTGLETHPAIMSVTVGSAIDRPCRRVSFHDLYIFNENDACSMIETDDSCEALETNASKETHKEVE